jgi:hypothetical protein
MNRSGLIGFAFGVATVLAFSSCGESHGAELFVSPGAVSQHFPRHGAQQTNLGAGIEYRGDTWGAQIMTYNNSNHHTTHAVLGEWIPLRGALGPMVWNAGMGAGLADGYKRNHGRMAPVAVPFDGVSYKSFEVRLRAAPPAEKNGSAMIAAQINVRVLEW